MVKIPVTPSLQCVTIHYLTSDSEFIYMDCIFEAEIESGLTSIVGQLHNANYFNLVALSFQLVHLRCLSSLRSGNNLFLTRTHAALPQCANGRVHSDPLDETA